MKKSHTETRGDRAAIVARHFGCSRATVFRDARYAAAVDAMTAVLGEDFKTRLLAGRTGLTNKAVVALAALPDEAIRGRSDAELKQLAAGRRQRRTRLDRARAAYVAMPPAERDEFRRWLGEGG
ncbi:MAG: hypothetical protein LLG00_04970 [Planctomycetaceae bacterium]|nr:hypothetical protein [Planctomycetaceae bacterium]